MGLLSVLLLLLAAFIAFAVYILFLIPRLNPLRHLSGPPVPKLLSNHLSSVLDPNLSPIVYENFAKKYGRSVRIRGVGPWDDRLLTLDPVSLSHIMKNTAIYQKPWQSRRLIDSLIGCGMLSAEGHVHKRQRRVATPAFSIQNMRALVPLVFHKGTQLKNRWLDIIASSHVNDKRDEKRASAVLDVCQWASRATFDVIGIAGFDYNFNAIQDESNEFFLAYKDMFEVCISQGKFWETLLSVYFPFLSKILPNERTRTVKRCQAIIGQEAGNLIQEKKRKIAEGEKSGVAYDAKDLLTLLLKSNVAVDLPIEQRISDEDIFNTINTVMFAGSDTSSLSLTWTLHLLSQHPAIQSHLRSELLSIVPPSSPELSELTEDEIQSLYSKISELPFLHNVVRESLRLIPPLHSSLRVATQDDLVPTMYPVHRRDGSVDEASQGVHIPKGSFVHVSIEAFNLDREVWGKDAWTFNPDRWDHLPEKVLEQPGLFSNIMSFSAGPRSCIGLRFAMIEIKTFLFILLTHFIFKEGEEKIVKANVVLTRPYIYKKFSKGCQLPMVVERYSATE